MAINTEMLAVDSISGKHKYQIPTQMWVLQ